MYFVQYSMKRTHKAKLIQLRYDTEHPIVVAPEPVVKDVSEEQNNTPAVRGEIIIGADTVDNIVGEDYDYTYQEMIDNALA